MKRGDETNGQDRSIDNRLVEPQQDCRRRRRQSVGQGRTRDADRAESVGVGMLGMPRRLAVIGEIQGRDDRAGLDHMAEHVDVPEGQRKVHGKREKRKP